MKVSQIFRYARPYDPSADEIDSLPNYFHFTYTHGQPLPLLEAGINPIQKINSEVAQRCPAILISSSPHKIGSAETPWQDFFDPDRGHIRYFGDNKRPGDDPATPNGNRALLEQFELHSSLEESSRIRACPIIFFKRVKYGGRAKGNVQFQGFGIIQRVERITQYDRKNDRAFTNYVFDFVVFSMADENEVFTWDWVGSRRNSALTDAQTLKYAPKSWQIWVKRGPAVIEQCRRRAVKLLTYNTDEQKPIKGSREDKVLAQIYEFYNDKKCRFEALAAFVAGRIIANHGQIYRCGWITPSTSDGGADFIGRLDVGTGFSRTKLIVLGQAKCEKLDTPTGGNHIARTVARLRRGWIGIYVTTSYFSEAVQREVIEDEYPIILVNGLRLAQEVIESAHEQGCQDVTSFLIGIDESYESSVVHRNPEEVLFI